MSEQKQDVHAEKEMPETDVDDVLEPDTAADVAADTDSDEAPLDPKVRQITALEDALASAEQTAKDEADKALRAVAEMENFKRRKNQEMENSRKYANEGFVRELLPMLDSFDHACLHAEDEENTKQMLDGFLLIQKQFHQVLEKFGVVEIEAMDQPFDPHHHQAISHEEVTGVATDTVVKEMQKGYRLHDRVLRPSLVVVAK